MKKNKRARAPKIHTLKNFYTKKQQHWLNLQRQSANETTKSSAYWCWCKIILTLKAHDDLVIAMPLARALNTWEPVGAPIGALRALYFARYTALVPHIEYQLQVAAEWTGAQAALRRYLLGLCKKLGVQAKIQFEKCNGSQAHALAFGLACHLEDRNQNGMDMVSDVVHWMTNMLGYSYAQEAEALLRHVHRSACNAFGGILAAPAFPNPLVWRAKR